LTVAERRTPEPAGRQRDAPVRRLRRPDLIRPVRPIVCVDLNGVLDRYTGWKDPRHWDPPRAGAGDFLRALSESGFDVVIFTTRHRVGVRQWLREHQLLDAVSAITDRKPPAHVFVDDRAVCFRGDFAETLEAVRSFTAHWEGPALHGRRASSARTRARNSTRRAPKR
jgi:hypothetical protein